MGIEQLPHFIVVIAVGQLAILVEGSAKFHRGGEGFGSGLSGIR